jgi:uncharacterized protein YbcI
MEIERRVTPVASDSKSRDDMRMRICDAVVGAIRDATGRGPTGARCTIDRDVVYVYLQDGLSAGERTLVERGRGSAVLSLRRTYQEAARPEMTAAVAEITGREVRAFMSADHVDPDCAVEVFVLGRSRDETDAG